MLMLLDIDGVMVPAKSWNSLQLLDDGFYDFDSKAVNALNSILSQTNADILLTTSHKSKYSVEKWKKIFQRRGVTVASLNKLSSNTLETNRFQEITLWNKNRDKDVSFVIIDDDKLLHDLPSPLKKRLIVTQPMIGLNQTHVHQILDILQG